MRDYYEGKYVCNEGSCSNETRTMFQPNKCVMKNCSGKLVAQKVSEKGVADTFNYLERLFDITKLPKASSEQKEEIKAAVEPYKNVYNHLKKKVAAARAHNGYDKIHLGEVFSFMNEFVNAYSKQEKEF